MFGKARQADMDLQALGERLAARKNELMNGASPRSGRGRSMLARALP
jgi:hypothetical protein